MGSNPYPHRYAPHRNSGTGYGHGAQPGAELCGEGGYIAQVKPQGCTEPPTAPSTSGSRSRSISPDPFASGLKPVASGYRRQRQAPSGWRLQVRTSSGSRSSSATHPVAAWQAIVRRSAVASRRSGCFQQSPALPRRHPWWGRYQGGRSCTPPPAPRWWRPRASSSSSGRTTPPFTRPSVRVADGR